MADSDASHDEVIDRFRRLWSQCRIDLAAPLPSHAAALSEMKDHVSACERLIRIHCDELVSHFKQLWSDYLAGDEPNPPEVTAYLKNAPDDDTRAWLQRIDKTNRLRSLNTDLVCTYDAAWATFRRDHNVPEPDLLSLVMSSSPNEETLIRLLLVEFLHRKQKQPDSTEMDYVVVPPSVESLFPNAVNRAIDEFRRLCGVSLEPGAIFAGCRIEHEISSGGRWNGLQSTRSLGTMRH